LPPLPPVPLPPPTPADRLRVRDEDRDDNDDDDDDDDEEPLLRELPVLPEAVAVMRDEKEEGGVAERVEETLCRSTLLLLSVGEEAAMP